jgi:hypothetical protein
VHLLAKGSEYRLVAKLGEPAPGPRDHHGLLPGPRLLGVPGHVPVGGHHPPNWVACTLAGEDRSEDARRMNCACPTKAIAALLSRSLASNDRPAPRSEATVGVGNIKEL